MQNSFVNDGYPHPGINRQYIGARYVPKFADPLEWSNALQYEPLTIVSYMGQTYTSKIPVPVGTPPTNTDFWALTGPQNAQIDCIMQKLSAVEAELSRMSTLAFRHDNVLILGDQWITQPSVSDCLISRLISAWPDSKINYVQTMTGGYTQSPAGGDSVADALASQLSKTPSMLDGVQSIIIAAGVNDIVNLFKADPTAKLGGFRQGSKETINAVRRMAPDVPIYLLFLGIVKIPSGSPAFNKFDGETLSYADAAIKRVAYEMDKVLYMDGAQAWAHNRLCVPLQDGSDPDWYLTPRVTSFGAKDFAEGIVSYFNTGGYFYNRSYVYHIDKSGDDYNVDNMQMAINFSGMELLMYFNTNGTMAKDIGSTADPFVLIKYLPVTLEDGTTGYPVGEIWTSHKSTPAATPLVVPTGYYWRQMETPTNPFTVNLVDDGKLIANPSSRSTGQLKTRNDIALKDWELIIAQHIRIGILEM